MFQYKLKMFVRLLLNPLTIAIWPRLCKQKNKSTRLSMAINLYYGRWWAGTRQRNVKTPMINTLETMKRH